MTVIDIIVFIIFATSVVAIGLIKSRGEKDTSEDYFLAGRGLTWPLIGFSLIAANISAEQMVGMSGAAANGDIGLAIASYEWMAAITLVCVGFFFLPMFLKSGIYTIPQYLEFRFSPIARTVMSVLMVIMLISVNISLVTYLGAKFLDPYINIASTDVGFIYPLDDIAVLCWVIGITAAVYVAAGGLKACAWADIIQGAALIVGGAVITWLALGALGEPDPAKGMNDATQVANQLGVAESSSVAERLGVLKDEKMHMFLPWTSSVIPWTALVVGLWIPNFYYWGLNQYIMQRALGSKSLAEGQKGIVFAAGMKLIIPFVVCVPGIIAFTLYSGEMADRIDGDAKTNRPVLLELSKTTGIELPESVRLAIANGSGRTTAEMPLEERLAITDAMLAEAPSSEGKLFPFDGDFADRQPALAEAVFAYNLATGGVAEADARSQSDAKNGAIDPEDAKPWTPSETLSNANQAIVDGNKSLPAAAPLVGYDYDDAFPILVSLLAGPGFKGFVIAAVMGAVVSSLASMLNAASTIFTMDIFKRFLKPDATDHQQVLVGRICVPIAVIAGCLIAPIFADPEFGGAFNAIQKLQTYLSPGILTIFLFGLFVPRAPRMAGVIGLVLSPILAAVYEFVVTPMVAGTTLGDFLFVNFLNRAALVVVTITVVLGLITVIKPLPQAIALPQAEGMELKSSGIAKALGIVVVILTVALYVVFA